MLRKTARIQYIKKEVKISRRQPKSRIDQIYSVLYDEYSLNCAKTGKQTNYIMLIAASVAYNER
jgi:hypothetical protein